MDQDDETVDGLMRQLAKYAGVECTDDDWQLSALQWALYSIECAMEGGISDTLAWD